MGNIVSLCLSIFFNSTICVYICFRWASRTDADDGEPWCPKILSKSRPSLTSPKRAKLFSSSDWYNGISLATNGFSDKFYFILFLFSSLYFYFLDGHQGLMLTMVNLDALHLFYYKTRPSLNSPKRAEYFYFWYILYMFVIILYYNKVASCY